jgi:hypothetical protein
MLLLAAAAAPVGLPTPVWWKLYPLGFIFIEEGIYLYMYFWRNSVGAHHTTYISSQMGSFLWRRWEKREKEKDRIYAMNFYYEFVLWHV